MLVKQCHVYHPPGKSPFLMTGSGYQSQMGGKNDIVLATLLMMSMMLGNRVCLIVTMILYRLLYDFLFTIVTMILYRLLYDFLLLLLLL